MRYVSCDAVRKGCGMTREEAIKIIQNEYKCVDRECDIEKSCGKCPYMMPTKEPILKAYEMAISALEQTDCFTNGRGEVIICDEFKGMPCEDAISRDMALEKMADYVASGYADSVEDFEEYSRIICQLPSVTQKSGKWIKKGNTLKCPFCGAKGEDIKDDYCFNYCPNCGAKMESEDKTE